MPGSRLSRFFGGWETSHPTCNDGILIMGPYIGAPTIGLMTLPYGNIMGVDRPWHLCPRRIFGAFGVPSNTKPAFSSTVRFTKNKVASKMEVLLMAEILHQLIGSLSYYLQGFIHFRWCRISAINSTKHLYQLYGYGVCGKTHPPKSPKISFCTCILGT